MKKIYARGFENALVKICGAAGVAWLVPAVRVARTKDRRSSMKPYVVVRGPGFGQKR